MLYRDSIGVREITNPNDGQSDGEEEEIALKLGFLSGG